MLESPGLKVAFITTIVPKNEPLELLNQCLPAMVECGYPHDTWLLDEGDDPAVKEICRQYGVYHFSRRNSSEFNTPNGKYTKTKGGNHNSWYDSYGKYYDYVAQIDTDFVPKPSFLFKTLGYFRDPKVAFVGTPQIYGNTNNSLVARGAAQQQFNFYGAVLRGLSGMGMTLLIGANHVIRVSAFNKVGHYTAHITEDLITGMKLHAKGFKSIYVPQPLAVGEGPSTWESYFNQQLRWAYGCIDILFHHSFGHFRKMGWRQILYYFFLQQHYFSGLIMALSIGLLTLYFFFGIRAADVDVFYFFIFYSFILIVCWLMSVWLQRYDIDQENRGQLNLAGRVISIAAWPIWFLAFISILTGKRLSYKVTPKGEDNSEEKISPLVFLPHFSFATVAITGFVGSFFTQKQSTMMLFWAISSALVMLSMPFASDLVKVWSKVLGGIYWGVEKVAFSNNTSFFKKYQRVESLQGVKEWSRDMIYDCIFLALVVLLSVETYIDRLGFYSDDWSFLGEFSLSKDKSLLGLIKTATTPNTLMRPMQNVYDALLFWLFNTEPFGYHLINALVFVLIILLFYFILRKLRVPRVIALTVPLVYALLPNYSTDRFWYASFQVNLSMLFFLISTYAGLQALSLKDLKALAWKIVSIFSLIISALSYEVILPLVLLNAILFLNPVEKLRVGKEKLQSHTVFIIVNFIALFYLVIFKAKTTVRLGDFNYPGDIVHLLVSTIHTGFFELGLKLPYLWGQILVNYPDAATLTLGFILYVVIFFYLYLTISKSYISFPSSLFMRNLVLIGVAIFFLGYAIFAVNNKVGFSPTGIDNRVAIAASMGMAFVIVGGVGWLSRKFLSEKYAKGLFCILIAIMASGGFIIIATLASCWNAAYFQSKTVLLDIQHNLPTLPHNSVFILDGVCPYTGPGIVFESQWDLKGALQIIYHDPTIQADIVTPRLKLTNQSIQTQIYTFKVDYPYTNTFVYNYKNKQIYKIENLSEAQSYFDKFNPDFNNNCPPSSAGNGVSIF